MAINSNSEDGRALRNTVPLSTFPLSAFEDLCKTAKVEQIQDAPIFKRGDTDELLVYLLKGNVSLESDGLFVDVITADSESAKFALAHQIPRKIDAVAKGAVRFVRLQPDIVNNPPKHEYAENQGVTVVEETGDDPDDWMTALLQLPLFQILPAASLQKILTSMKTMAFTTGEVIIDSSKKVDQFFIVAKGECLLQSEYGEVKLEPGDSFGEAYALAAYPVKERVMALSDGSLITLEQNHFFNGVIKQLVKYIKLDELPDWLSKGAFLLDVRASHNYARQHQEGSVNMPLLSLSRRLADLPRDKTIILICANGKASEAAAFILFKHGLDVPLVIKGGMAIYESEEPEKVETPQPEVKTEPALVIKSDAEQARDKVEASNEADLEYFSMQADSFEAGLHALKLENERLLARNQELEVDNARLLDEKAKLEQENQTLTQHLNRLKEILNRFNKR